METVLKNTRPTAKQMFLDPRTKIMLCLTVSCVMISSDSFGIMNVVLPCLAAIPLLFLILLKKPHIAAYCAVMYLITATVPRLLMPHVSPLFNLLFAGMIAMFTKLIPGMSMFCLLVLTTTVSEFVAAMDRLHISKKFSVPVSVMFRFLPTIREEYRAIRDAMRLREVGSWRNPMEMLEYRMVRLLTGLVTIGNELSTSALTRGLDAPVRRTNVCPIGFHWQDSVALLLCIVVITCFVLSTFYGWYPRFQTSAYDQILSKSCVLLLCAFLWAVCSFAARSCARIEGFSSLPRSLSAWMAFARSIREIGSPAFTFCSNSPTLGVCGVLLMIPSKLLSFCSTISSTCFR